MTKDEIRDYVETLIEYQCDEFGLVREEVIENVLFNIIYYYFDDKISEDDLIKCGEYLGYILDMDKINKDKIARKVRKERRKAQKLKRKEKKTTPKETN